MIDKAGAAAAADRASMAAVRAAIEQVARKTATDPLAAGRALATADEIIGVACEHVRDHADSPTEAAAFSSSLQLAQAKALVGIGNALVSIARSLEAVVAPERETE